MVDFGNRLKTLRLQHNFTQSELAEKLSLTKSVISAYETGLRLPSYDVLIAISRVFRVTTDFLLGVDSKSKNFHLDLSGLTEDEISALKNLVKAMQNN